MSRLAVVLFNLGGPDSLEAVEPFLYNLFADPAIIALPGPVRRLVARLVAHRRAPVARHIYARMGNSSPIVANTEIQARALETKLGEDTRAFVAMRYWAPFTQDAAQAVLAWKAEEIVLLPLYPQFSSTTTGSSLVTWREVAERIGLRVPTRTICCYPADDGFVTALARRLDTALAEWPEGVPVRILLSAHGLPQRIVARGDPYQTQVEQTAAAVRARVARDVEMIVCYQSRVGPLKWLEPATDAEIRRAGAERVGLIVLPIAFVSEHSETLVELDLDYGRLAAEAGVPRYVRAPTVSADAAFIAGLAELVQGARRRQSLIGPGGKGIACNAADRLCPCAARGTGS
ncbi:MAG TPA: ferrochelatase [Stellaceae bacterium]|nr:ferrochelatase [Stellaceae bacterium]